MKSILAEQLKQGDVIVIPDTSQTSQRKIKVSGPMTFTPLLVQGIGKNLLNDKEVPFQFGRKVNIDIE